MAQDHTLMTARYELKYLIPQRLAVRVRHFVRQYLELDEYCQGQPNSSSPVHSLDLDSEDWKVYWQTVIGDKNRFKLRVRYYNESEATPVYWEIKRRMQEVILKQRCGIKRSAAARVLDGQLPEPAEMASPCRPAEQHAIQELLRLQFSLEARGKLHVAYDREAYLSARNNEVRVTFDRHVRVVPRPDQSLTTRLENPFVCTGPGEDPADVVILELKFTERFPGVVSRAGRDFRSGPDRRHEVLGGDHSLRRARVERRGCRPAPRALTGCQRASRPEAPLERASARVARPTGAARLYAAKKKRPDLRPVS